jgi:hypothetical protein
MPLTVYSKTLGLALVTIIVGMVFLALGNSVGWWPLVVGCAIIGALLWKHQTKLHYVETAQIKLDNKYDTRSRADAINPSWWEEVASEESTNNRLWRELGMKEHHVKDRTNMV